MKEIDYTTLHKDLTVCCGPYGITASEGSGRFLVDGKEVSTDSFMKWLREASEKMEVQEIETKETCGNCIHENACFYAAGGCGSLTNTDSTHCLNYITLSGFLNDYAPAMGWEKK